MPSLSPQRADDPPPEIRRGDPSPADATGELWPPRPRGTDFAPRATPSPVAPGGALRARTQRASARPFRTSISKRAASPSDDGPSTVPLDRPSRVSTVPHPSRIAFELGVPLPSRAAAILRPPRCEIGSRRGRRAGPPRIRPFGCGMARLSATARAHSIWPGPIRHSTTPSCDRGTDWGGADPTPRGTNQFSNRSLRSLAPFDPAHLGERPC